MNKIAEIRAGFKPSPLGPIPIDWEVKRLKEILIEGKLGGNYENAEANNGIPVIKMGNLGRAVMKINKIQYLPLDGDYNKDDVLKEGDLLFNTRNTLELVGKVAIWRNELPLAIYNSNIMRMKFNEGLVGSNYFMNFAFNSHYGLSQLRGIATGTTSVAAIYGRDLETIKFLLPPLPEQQKIAAILSTWDEAISKTQQLIMQLKERNRGLQQQLLTGRKRLKGFEGKWKTKILEECLIYIQREVPKPSSRFFALGIRCHGKGVFHKNDFEPEDLAMDVLYEVKENDFIVNITFAWEHAVAIAGKQDDGGLVSHRFPTYTFNIKNAIPEYFRYFILQKYFKCQLDLISPGGAGRNRVMSKKDFPKIEVYIPEVDEQFAIANVMNQAFKELRINEQKLESLTQQKKGLMQKLLTGQIRVNPA